MELKHRTLVVAGVLIGLLVVETGLRMFDPLVPGPSSWPSASTHVKSDQLSERSGEVKILLLGSSITAAAVEPRYLDELTGLGPSYNAAIPFFSPVVAERWLQTVLDDSDFAPNIAVIGLPIFPGHTDESAETLSSAIDRAVELDEFASNPLAPALLSNKGLFAEWDRLTLWDAAERHGLWTGRGHFTGYYGNTDRSIERRVLRPEEEHSQREAAALDRVVRLLRSRGARVALVVEPGRFPGDADSQVVAAFIESLAATGEALGLPVWNAYGVPWEDDLYADEVHFNRAGVLIYTEYLAGMIRQWDESTADSSRRGGIRREVTTIPGCPFQKTIRGVL